MKRIPAVAAAAALALVPFGATAQSPQPAPPSPPPIATMTPATSAPATQVPATAPSSSAPSRPGTTPRSGESGNGAHSFKKIPAGSLSLADVRYGLTHPLQEANQLRKMKTVSFDKLRIYKLPSALKTTLDLGDARSEIPALAVLGPGVEVAQAGLPRSNGSNSPIAYLQWVLANVNVSNALNTVSVLNGANINVGVTLKDVLNGNKISIGQVAGIFVNGMGVITTITK